MQNRQPSGQQRWGIGLLPEFLHFGFRLDDPAEVHLLLTRLRGNDVPIIEEHNEPTYVAFKCLDPDGYRIEGYWEPAGDAAGPRRIAFW